MRNKALYRVCVILLMTVMMMSVILGVASYTDTEILDGVFYAHTHSPSSMSGANAKESSLGAVSLPGHNIVEDSGAEMIVRNQQYNLKSAIMFLIISIILAALCPKFFGIAINSTRKSYRLLI